ncbi:DUF502 domain-containing protein [Chitinophagaceae bacterium LWZ2-11]
MLFTGENGKTVTKGFFRRLLKLFLQGLVVLAPIGITMGVVVWLFNLVDGILPNIVSTLFPSMVTKDINGSIHTIPGLGFVIVIVLVVLVGWVSSSFIVSRLVDVLDTVLERTPGIKFIYSSVKDFFEAFAGNNKKFDKAVLVNVDAPDVWRVGFITRDSAEDLGVLEHLIVYVPHSYAISGITYIVPKDRVRIVENISAAEAMKFAVSGGVTDIGHHHHS